MKKLTIFLLLAIFLKTLNSQGQTVDTLTIQSKIFNDTRKIRVVLPKGYGKYSISHPNKDRDYMVAYMFDGQDEDLYNLCKTTINYLSSSGKSYSQPLILVTIPANNRWREFLPKSQAADGVKNYPGNGGADMLAAYVRDEVIPVIKSKYHVKPYSIGIGHSLGGTFVTYCMLKYPGLFNAGIAISPNYQYDNEQMVHKFDSLASEKTLNHKYLYIAHGYGDETEERFRPATEKVRKLLMEKNIRGLKWQVEALSINAHGLTPAGGIFKGFYGLNEQINLTEEKMNAFLADKKKPFIDNIKEFYTSASAWSGIKVPLNEDINLWAYNLAGNHNKECLEFFDWGISLYPDDANLYDSAGEIEALIIRDKITAVKYYTAGLDMVNRNKNKLSADAFKRQSSGFEKHIAELKK